MAKKQKEQGFKLIGITPLSSCDPEFSKNLEIGRTYQFYSGYDVVISDDLLKIESVALNKNGYIDLYELKNGIKLNISAVVGKNGTGKSTLFEMLYYLIYAISTDKTIGNQKVLSTEWEDAHKELEVAKHDYMFLESCIQLHEKNRNGEALNEEERVVYENPFLIALEMQRDYKIQIQKNKMDDGESFVKAISAEFLDNVLRKLSENLDKAEKWEKLFRENFACSILYESGGVIQEISYRKSKFKYAEFKPNREEKISDINKFDFRDFFYSVSLNFSHHSLNSKSIGKWINKLFHKNDAYTTPVVITPMRDNGNFDINHELKLSKERLMGNVLYDLVNKKESYLLDKYKVSKFIFIPKKRIVISALDFTESFLSTLKSSVLFKKRLGITKLDDYVVYWDFAIGYLENKINKISYKYRHIINESEGLFNNDEKLNRFLLEDKSHITKKIRQVMNFLEISYKNKNRNFWKNQADEFIKELSEKEMLEWLSLFGLNLEKLSPSDLIEIGLPGFFTIDFLLEDKEGNKIEFSRLSSGEQQMILNTNSILYHLFNLDSVHHNSSEMKEAGFNRIAYKNVNIILDEVELYYHPDMQRRLVYELVNNFERIKTSVNNGITSINVCILTHSPFVLSDIPSSNVLRLSDEEESVDMQTFGANVHDILANSFFLENGFMGEFAKELITDLINYLIYDEEKELSTNIVKPIREWNNERAQKVIGIIDEPLIKERVQSLYNKKVLYRNKELLRQKIQELNIQLKKLENEKD